MPLALLRWRIDVMTLGDDWHTRARPIGSEELATSMAPIMSYCIEQFGPNRCMFESNFPVDKVSFSHQILFNGFKRFSKSYSASERAARFTTRLFAPIGSATSDRRSAMRDYRYDHVHLRSPDPDATARFFETMFGAQVTRGVYPPGTLYRAAADYDAAGRPDCAYRAAAPG